MKSILFFALTLSATANAGDVYYCGASGVEGAYVKVDPAAGIMCLSSGQWAADYCARPHSETYTLQGVRTGKLTLATQTASRDFEYQEFLGLNAATGKSQLVRVFNEASNPTGGNVTMHRADLAGASMTLINSDSPVKEALDGDSACLRGEDGAF